MTRRVIMIHGAGGGAWEWNVWRGVFEAEGLDCEVLELVPEAGGIGATRLEDYVGQVGRAAREGDVLVGASLGGLLALACAPVVRPAALVLVNAMPPAPWHSMLPGREAYPGVIPWGSEASLAGTRAAMPDAEDAACLYAFRRWRDASGAVMNAARAGIDVAQPACPVLVMASERDEDVPMAASAALAEAFGASLIRVAGASHVGPLLGRGAAGCALQAIAWLNSTTSTAP
jgi:pimeloyl-ACP methyl ester carboxylesterase